MLQHIVTVFVLLQHIVLFQHVGIFPQYNIVAKIYVMHAAMCDFESCRQVCRGKCEKWVMATGMLCLHKTDGISYRVQCTYTSWSWSLLIWCSPFVQHFKPINDIKHLTYIVIRIRRLREVWCGGPIYLSQSNWAMPSNVAKYAVFGYLVVRILIRAITQFCGKQC